jgi:capsular polysaccharide biosynthesis protein
VELEAESSAQRTWTPVLQVPEETVAVATFQWKRVPLTRGVLLRLGAIAAAIVFACGVLAFGVSEMLPKTYGARTEIVYPITIDNPSGNTLRQDRVLSTQLVAIKSRAVLSAVAPTFHMTAEQLSKKIVASVLQDSEVIRIEADDASQAKALDIVSAVSKEYIKNNASVNPNKAAEDQLARSIATYTGTITTLNNRLNIATQNRQAGSNPNNPSSDELQLQTQLALANTQLANATSQLNQLSVNDAQAPKLQLLTEPYAAGKVAPKPMRAGIAGVLAGMMIAAGVVVLLLRRRLRNIPADQFG